MKETGISDHLTCLLRNLYAGQEATDKELISKIYKHLMEFSIKKTNNTMKKSVEDLNKHLSKKTYRWPSGM